MGPSPDPSRLQVDCNFTWLQLKLDHQNRPLWVTPDGRIFLETFSNIYKQVCECACVRACLWVWVWMWVWV